MRPRHAHAALLPTFASLLALIVVPALHGSLSHGHPTCVEAEAHHGACLDGGEAHDPGVESGEHCPLCLAAGRSRAALPGLAVVPVSAPAVSVGRVLPGGEPPRSPLGRHAPAAPRAPPHCA